VTQRLGEIAVHTRIEAWPFLHPFVITGYTFTDANVLVVELRQDGVTGRGESLGVYYLDDTVEKAQAQVEAIADRLTAPIAREELIEILPAGGARNAVDAALWDLEAKLQGRPAWQIAGVPEPRPLTTTYTISAGEPGAMAETARGFTKATNLKLKLTGTDEDADRVLAVRAARPDAWIGVDGNQGFTRKSLATLMPVLVEARVQLVEQPFPRENYDDFLDLDAPIPVAADESALDLDDLPKLAGRVDVINIKLDKCGGLTRGLAIARETHRRGMKTMVGCMGGTSLSMAPAFILGQICELVDLDGPVLLSKDRVPSVVYDAAGHVFSPPALWGYPDATSPRS
jgi:L-Ala-D/L-Glu epimerase